MNTLKKNLLTCAILIGSVSCSLKNQELPERNLFPIPHILHKNYERDDTPPKYKDKDGKPVSGYVNRDGKLVINLQFDYADEFSDGLARVVIDKKFGYINTKGEFVIKPQFDDAENFDRGSFFAAVKVGSKYGYIDKTGNYAIDPQFDDAGKFTWFSSEIPGKSNYSLAPVKVGDKWGFIDRSGSYAVAPQFSMVGPFSEGRALAKVGDKCGYIDETGKMVIAAQYECSGFLSQFGLTDRVNESGRFSEGLACVQVKNELRQIKTPAESPAREPSVTYLTADTEPGYKYGFIDRTGRFVIEPQFEIAWEFSNGLAVVGFHQNLTVLQEREESDGKFVSESVDKNIVKFGFINVTGQIAINPMFGRVKSFAHFGNTESGFDRKWLAAVSPDQENKHCG